MPGSKSPAAEPKPESSVLKSLIIFKVFSITSGISFFTTRDCKKIIVGPFAGTYTLNLINSGSSLGFEECGCKVQLRSLKSAYKLTCGCKYYVL